MKKWICALLAALLLLPASGVLAETVQFLQLPDGSTLGFVITEKDGLFGLEDTEGKELLPAIYREVSVGPEGILVQDTDTRYGFLNPDGSWLIEPKYDYADRFYDGIALVGRDFGYTLVDKTGAEILPLQPARIEPTMYGNYYTCSYDEKTIIWDTAGQQVAEVPYETTWLLDLSMFGIIVDGRAGAAGVDGIVVPAQYDSVDVIGTGVKETDGFVIRAISGEGERWFRADGTQIGDQTWENTGAAAVCGGAIMIARDGKVGLMDMDGNVILQPIYEDLCMVNGDDTNDAELVAVQLNGKVGLLKWDGSAYQELVPPVWSRMVKLNYMRRMKDGSIAVVRIVETDRGSEMRYGLIAPDGRILLEPVYASIFWNDDTDSIAVHTVTEERQQVVWAAEGESLPDDLLREEPVRAEILELQQMGILQGDSSGDLRLWDSVTRAEFLAMLARAEKWDTSGAPDSGFSDVAGNWAADIIGVAVQKGLVQGSDGKFRPDDPVSYEDGFRILLRALGVPDEHLQGQRWLNNAAYEADIQLYPESYSSAWPLPREQAGKLIYDYLHTEKTAEDVLEYLYPVVEP